MYYLRFNSSFFFRTFTVPCKSLHFPRPHVTGSIAIQGLSSLSVVSQTCQALLKTSQLGPPSKYNTWIQAIMWYPPFSGLKIFISLSFFLKTESDLSDSQDPIISVCNTEFSSWLTLPVFSQKIQLGKNFSEKLSSYSSGTFPLCITASLLNWHSISRFFLLELKCPENEQWTYCAGCESTCDNVKISCDDYCEEARCECSTGLLRNHRGKCVRYAECLQN